MSTKVRRQRCRRCRRWTLAGFDVGLPAVVEPRPINADTELAALLVGRWTYDKLVDGTLRHRDPTLIADRDRPVYVAHHCPEVTR